MRILIRTDVGGAYGLGHLSRMLTLAKQIERLDDASSVTFVTTTPALHPFAEPDDYDVLVPPVAGEDQILRYLAHYKQPGDVLVLDTPVVHDDDQLRQVCHTMPVVRIDHPWAEAGSADLLVLPGMHYTQETLERLDGDFGDGLLVGADYVLLHEQVQDRKRRPYRGREPWLMFCAGGSDPHGVLALLYDMTRPLGTLLPGVQRVFCVGQLAAPFTVRELAPDAWLTGYDVRYLQHAALAVGLFGVTAYEALYLGTPLLALVSGNKPDDIKAVDTLHAATDGAVENGAAFLTVMREDLCDYLVHVWRDVPRRRAMHKASSGVVDSRAAQRIAARILTLEP